MGWASIIIILLVGLALVALEIVALPGGVSGICGGLMVALGVWQTYAHHGTLAGNITLVSSLAVGVIMLVILMKSGTWRYFSLHEESDSRVNEAGQGKVAVGDRGTTVTRLAPSGNAMINNEIIEVHSDGQFIDEHTAVEVTEIEGYKITVKAVN